jgi:DNA polymerase delta subunit 3
MVLSVLHLSAPSKELTLIRADAATVTRASRAAEPEPDPKSEDEDEGEGEPMEAIESDNVKPAPVKRKPKKVVPVGKNGLKKKRVVKSKSHIDDEGFMGAPRHLF